MLMRVDVVCVCVCARASVVHVGTCVLMFTSLFVCLFVCLCVRIEWFMFERRLDIFLCSCMNVFILFIYCN